MNNIETAYAKINLALHILGRRDDGYHDIDTIFAFMDSGDTLSVEHSDSIKLDITGPFASALDCDMRDNLITKVAFRLREHCNVNRGARITLTKNLPIASGIGGGSADAAAAARLLNRYWELNNSLEELCAIVGDLGADIAACIHSGTCRGEGIGNDILLLSELQTQGIPILLVNPKITVSTGPIFTAWDGQSGGRIDKFDVQSIVKYLGNDMERAAVALFPKISEVLNALQHNNPVLSRMSGSGATCFAIYDTLSDRDNAKAYIEEHYKDWWCMDGKLK